MRKEEIEERISGGVEERRRGGEEETRRPGEQESRSSFSVFCVILFVFVFVLSLCLIIWFTMKRNQLLVVDQTLEVYILAVVRFALPFLFHVLVFLSS